MSATAALQQQLSAAMAAHRSGDLATAAQHYRALLNSSAADHFMRAEALQLLAVIARQQGNADLALQLVTEALHANPCHPGILANCALLLREKKKLTEAIAAARMALSYVPDHAEALEQLGGCLLESGQSGEAWTYFKHLTTVRPSHAEGWHGLALIALFENDFLAADQALTQALACHPTSAVLFNTLGNLRKCEGRYAEAKAAYMKAYALDPALLPAAVVAGMIDLLQGNDASGYDLYNRRALPHRQLQEYAPWQGEAVETLLIVAEQGLGDTLHMLRYAALIAARGIKQFWLVQPELQKLAQTNVPSGTTVLTLTDPWPPAAAAIRTLSLPQVLGVQHDWQPYLKPDAHLKISWQVSFASVRRPRIGFVWAGNPQHVNDANRSLPLPLAADLIEQFHPHSIVLQKDAAAVAALLERAPALRCFGKELNSFSDTAAAVNELDLLVTVDTSVAHLAGAMGKPTWLLLPFDPDWRWGLESSHTPWYPCMQLYRCPRPRQWKPVLEKLREDLKAWLL